VTPPHTARGRLAVLLSVVTGAAALIAGAPLPAPAAPGDVATDAEGGTATLRAALEIASKGYSDARARLTASRSRQAALVRERLVTEARVNALSKDVDALAAIAYRTGRVTPMTAALDGNSLPGFFDRSAILGQLSSKNNAKMTALTKARTDLEQQKRQVDREIQVQAAQEQTMANQKGAAERALVAVGGGVSGGVSGGASATATSAPRNPDGSFAPQDCTVDDPTTDRCITPRMLHAYQQARAAGFTNFTACSRPASFGEHPKGRACDFAAAKSTFGGVATGAEKAYGERLAGYFVDNSDRLGVLYVIWFKQIWLPGTGWRAYDGGNGDPASDHTNHVHLSVQ
jgi:hypothetical protein